METAKDADDKLYRRIDESPSSIPTIPLAGGCAFFLGIAILSCSFAVAPFSTSAYLLFWTGICTALLGILGLGARKGSSRRQRLVALSFLGALLYVPYLLRSPFQSTLQDELYHVQMMQLIRQVGSTNIPITSFPIPGEYPGLEILGTSLGYATQLPDIWVIRALPFLIHTAAPIVVFLTMKQAGLGDWEAFYGSVIYVSNASYFTVDSMFSYETLGLILFLLVVLLALRTVSPWMRRGSALSLLLLVILIALTVTHHLSGAMAVLFLSLLAIAVWARSRRESPSLLNVALFAAVTWFAWLISAAYGAVHYISGNLIDRIRATLAIILQEQAQPRVLFSSSPAPIAEKALGYLYPTIILLLILLGLWRTRKALRGKAATSGTGHNADWLALAVMGPLIWIVTAPLILTQSSDLVYRMWPFLFLGVGLFGAMGAAGLLNGNRRPRDSKVARAAIVYTLVLVLVAGGIVVGDNQAGRFGGPQVRFAAGPEDLTPVLRSSATWLRSEAGDYNDVVGDVSTGWAFATIGFQRTNLVNTWIPYYTMDNNRVNAFLSQSGADFLVVDLRDAQYPARYGTYFGSGVPTVANGVPISPGSPIAIGFLTKFGNDTLLTWVFDSGDIIIYAYGGSN